MEKLLYFIYNNLLFKTQNGLNTGIYNILFNSILLWFYFRTGYTYDWL